MAYRDQGPYGQSRQDQGNPYGQQPYGDVERGQGFQMSDMNGRGGDAVHDPNYILNELSALEVDIDKTLSSHIQKAKDAQKKAIIDRDLSGDSSKAADALTNVAVAYCKELVLRLDGIIHNPRSMEPRNRPTADRLRRKLHAVTQDLEAATMTYRQESTEGVARQIRITDRDMSVEDSRRNAETLLSGGPVQIFSQRLMMGNRHGESANAFRAVQARHEDIQRTLRTLAEVNAVFAEMRTLVIQQEPVVNQINEQSEVVHQNVDQANHQLDGAIKSAKAANRKKWYCLGIAALIIIIIIIIVVIVVKVVLNK